jgi:DsbC/DsbD-like thiol-disulfide interchange protein
MIRSIALAASMAALFLSLSSAEPATAGEWTKPVEVRYDAQKCVAYRAKLQGNLLVIQATHEPGWHTYAMDNTLRAAEKLAGRRSLALDRPTEITLAGGLEQDGRWHQSVPKDFSKPDLRWYAWGFEGEALFVARIRRAGPEPASLAIRGQACSESTCKNIDVVIPVPLAGRSGTLDVNLKNLVQVR